MERECKVPGAHHACSWTPQWNSASRTSSRNSAVSNLRWQTGKAGKSTKRSSRRTHSKPIPKVRKQAEGNLSIATWMRCGKFAWKSVQWAAMYSDGRRCVYSKVDTSESKEECLTVRSVLHPFGTAPWTSAQGWHTGQIEKCNPMDDIDNNHILSCEIKWTFVACTNCVWPSRPRFKKTDRRAPFLSQLQNKNCNQSWAKKNNWNLFLWTCHVVLHGC